MMMMTLLLLMMMMEELRPHFPKAFSIQYLMYVFNYSPVISPTSVGCTLRLALAVAGVWEGLAWAWEGMAWAWGPGLVSAPGLEWGFAEVSSGIALGTGVPKALPRDLPKFTYEQNPSVLDTISSLPSALHARSVIGE